MTMFLSDMSDGRMVFFTSTPTSAWLSAVSEMACLCTTISYWMPFEFRALSGISCVHQHTKSAYYQRMPLARASLFDSDLQLSGLGVEGADGGLQVLHGSRQLHLRLPERLLHVLVVLARLYGRQQAEHLFCLALHRRQGWSWTGSHLEHGLLQPLPLLDHALRLLGRQLLVRHHLTELCGLSRQDHSIQRISPSLHSLTPRWSC